MSNFERRIPASSDGLATARLLVVPALAVVLAALLTLPGTPAAGQEAAPLFVDFDFGDYPAVLLPDPATAKQQVLDGVVAAADAKLPWRFRAAAGEGDYPRLAVRIVREGGDYKLEATLKLDPDTRGCPPWSGGFVSEQEREELDGFPAPSQIPDRVVERFDEQVLTPDRVALTGGELFTCLRQRVPLGQNALLEPGDERGVVGLDWSKHYRYSLSTFRMDCRNAAGELVSLYSKGTGGSVPFPDTPAFPALVVKHTDWWEGNDKVPVSPAHLQRLGELSPQKIFLEDFDSRGLTLEPETASVGPTLAPGAGEAP